MTARITHTCECATACRMRAIRAGREGIDRAHELLRVRWSEPTSGGGRGRAPVFPPRDVTLLSPDLVPSAVGALDCHTACWPRILHAEKLRRQRYTWMMRLRTDLMYARPLPPYSTCRLGCALHLRGADVRVLPLPRQIVRSRVNRTQLLHSLVIEKKIPPMRSKCAMAYGAVRWSRLRCEHHTPCSVQAPPTAPRVGCIYGPPQIAFL